MTKNGGMSTDDTPALTQLTAANVSALPDVDERSTVQRDTRQPSFSGCRRQDLERTAGQSRLNNVITVFSAPFEDIFVAAIFLLALQWT